VTRERLKLTYLQKMADRWEEKWNLLFPVNSRCNLLVLVLHTVKLFVTLKVHVHAALSSETG